MFTREQLKPGVFLVSLTGRDEYKFEVLEVLTVFRDYTHLRYRVHDLDEDTISSPDDSYFYFEEYTVVDYKPLKPKRYCEREICYVQS